MEKTSICTIEKRAICATLNCQWAGSMECIFKVRELLEKIWALSESCSVSDTRRNRLVSSMLFMSLNHCDAIQLLSQKRNFASSYALLRPLFETTFRAIWLHNCATDEQVDKCIEKDKWKSAWDLVQEIESHTGNPPIFSKMWNELRTFMHSFTHGGIQNAVRQIGDENYITPNLSDDEVFQLMQKVGLFSLTILSELIDLAEKEDFIPLYEELSLSFQAWAINKSGTKDVSTHASP